MVIASLLGLPWGAWFVLVTGGMCWLGSRL